MFIFFMIFVCFSAFCAESESTQDPLIEFYKTLPVQEERSENWARLFGGAQSKIEDEGIEGESSVEPRPTERVSEPDTVCLPEEQGLAQEEVEQARTQPEEPKSFAQNAWDMQVQRLTYLAEESQRQEKDQAAQKEVEQARTQPEEPKNFAQHAWDMQLQRIRYLAEESQRREKEQAAQKEQDNVAQMKQMIAQRAADRIRIQPESTCSVM